MECFPLEILKLIITQSCLFRDAVAFVSCSRGIHGRLVSRNQSAVDACILLCPDQYSIVNFGICVRRECRSLTPEGYRMKREARNFVVQAAKTYMSSIFTTAGDLSRFLNEESLQVSTFRTVSLCNNNW